jgi:hypothetical protein
MGQVGSLVHSEPTHVTKKETDRILKNSLEQCDPTLDPRAAWPANHNESFITRNYTPSLSTQIADDMAS